MASEIKCQFLIAGCDSNNCSSAHSALLAFLQTGKVSWKVKLFGGSLDELVSNNGSANLARLMGGC